MKVYTEGGDDELNCRDFDARAGHVKQADLESRVDVRGTGALRATDTALGVRLSIWDALIVEAAAAAGSDHLLTEDLNDGQTIRDVQIINPFATVG